MALSAVVFDVGETLVDERVAQERWAAERSAIFVFAERDLHADALPCLAELRAHGLRLGAAGNMPTSRRRTERSRSSLSWSCRK
ncbi:MAG TPA: hypothetical protein VGH46_11875 [Gaiellaceae bacterium]|jgi:FMN phosphatase YigB (HAD superfamily)